MKNTQINILILIVAIIIAYYVKLGIAIKNLDFTAGKIQNVNLRDGSLNFIANIIAVNGDIMPIPVTSVNTRLILGGTEIGTAILGKTVFVSGKARTAVPILCSIPYGSLFQIPALLLTMLRTGNLKATIRGYAGTIGLTSPEFDTTFGFTIPKINI